MGQVCDIVTMLSLLMRGSRMDTNSGFPFVTSSATTKASGTGISAFSSAAAAYLRVADVQIAQRG